MSRRKQPEEPVKTQALPLPLPLPLPLAQTESSPQLSLMLESLRQRAEERVPRVEPEETLEDVRRTVSRLCEAIYEQHVLQEELRMQNEELLRTQEELAAANGLVSDLFEYAPVGYVSLDRDGSILRANETAAVMLGVSREKLARQKLNRYVERDSQDAFFLHQRAVFEEGGKQHCVLGLRGSAGQRMEVRLESLVCREVRGGEPCFSRTAILDISGEREARGWRDQAQRLQQMVEELPAAAVFVKGTQVQINRAAEHLTGYSRRELETLEDLGSKLFGPHREEIRALYREMSASGFREPSPTVSMWRKDGAERVVQGFAHRFDDEEIWLIHDLTERVRAEESARRAEFTIHHSCEAIFWVNPEGRLLFANQAACLLSGYRPDELLQMRLMDLTLAMTPREWEAWWHRLRSEGFFRLERRFRSKKGVEFPISLSANHLDFCGEEYGCLFVRDISARRRAEAELRESESRLRQIAEQIADVIMLVDASREKKVLYCSPAFERIWGRPVEDLYRNRLVWLEGIHPLDRERVRTAISEMHRTGTREEEYRVVRPDGSERWVRDRAFPIRQGGGEVDRIAVLAEDITERREAEEDQARLGALVTSSSAAILAMDLDGIIRHWNPAAERLFGFRQGEIIGRRSDLLVPEDCEEENRSEVASVREGKAPRQIETIRLHKDGMRIDVALTLSLICGAKGEAMGMAALIQDIRQRKRLEWQVTAAAQEEQQRIAMELHDGLGSLLTVIDCRATGLSRVLEKAGQMKEADEARGVAQDIRDAIKQLRNLTSGLQPLDDDPESLLAALRDLAHRTALSGRMKCRFEPPARDQSFTVRDASMANHLLSIAREAVHNAVRHSGGSQLVIRLRQREGVLELSISDNGRGFQPEERRTGGLGIGTMEYRASLLGGRLIIRRRKGNGMRVTCEVGGLKPPPECA